MHVWEVEAVEFKEVPGLWVLNRIEDVEFEVPRGVEGFWGANRVLDPVMAGVWAEPGRPVLTIAGRLV